MSAPPPPPPAPPICAAQRALILVIPLIVDPAPPPEAEGHLRSFAMALSEGPAASGASPAGAAAQPINISPGGGLVHFATAGEIKVDGAPVLDSNHNPLGLVIAIYDGEWDPYIDAFLNNPGVVFLLDHYVLPISVGGPALIPVAANWTAFKIWLKNLDVSGGALIADGPTASMVRNMLPIPGAPWSGTGQANGELPPAPPPPKPVITGPPVDFDDIQGLILRGYNMTYARHYLLQVADPRAARAALADLVGGDVQGVPKLTTAAKWTVKPPACLNIGVTCDGLEALGLDPGLLKEFPAAFLRGARDATTLAAVGDIEANGNDPSNWDEPYRSGRIDVALMIHVTDPEEREVIDGALRAFVEGPFKLLGVDAADDLFESRIHFGYVDGIAQPLLDIEGLYDKDNPARPDGGQGFVEAGRFLWGQTRTQAKPFPLPAADGGKAFLNSSFAAFRKLEQDVVAFEAFLDAAAKDAAGRGAPGFIGATSYDRELVAAKLCGRWRSGVPLELCPTSPDYADLPDEQAEAVVEAVSEAKPPKTLNDFNFTGDYFARTGSNAHILHGNPRSAPEGADIASAHRVMRRALPYGPEYNPADPLDIPRGLIGPFIGLDLEDQFEFLMGAWMITGAAFAVPNPDAFLGPEADFWLQRATGQRWTPIATCPLYQPDPPKQGTHPQFIHTKGSIYLLLPSVTALKYLAGLIET